MAESTKKTIVQRLAEGPVIGDGGYVWIMEKRGYALGGPFTPEVVLQHPDAVKELHNEFIRAGSDVLQALTYLTTEDKLKTVKGNYKTEDLNRKACEMAREAGRQTGALIAGGVNFTPSYLEGKGKDAVQGEFRKQCDVFIQNDVDFILAEFIGHIEEMEWALEVVKSTGKPVAATMRMGPTGDISGVPPGECAVRMAKAGADIVGLNCLFDFKTCLKTMQIMKEALDAEGLKPFLMLQPLGFHVPEVEGRKLGYFDLPEYPFALEPRVYTRWDVRRFARDAYNLGVRYLGGCCGFEPYHIREMVEELSDELGKRPPGAEMNSLWGEGLRHSCFPVIRQRASKEHWSNIKPSFGRLDCPVEGTPDKTD